MIETPWLMNAMVANRIHAMQVRESHRNTLTLVIDNIAVFMVLISFYTSDLHLSLQSDISMQNAASMKLYQILRVRVSNLKQLLRRARS